MKFQLFSIGVDAYNSGQFHSLNNAVLDINMIAQVLKDRYSFIDILPPLTNERATRKEILSCLNQLIGITTEDDTLIVHYAGHGREHPLTREGYLIPFDATDDPTDFIPHSEIVRHLKEIPAKHIFFICDSCFSGAFFAKYRDSSSTVHRKIALLKSRWIITSGRQESVSDGAQGEGSPFTIALKQALILNNKRYCRVSEIAKRTETHFQNAVYGQRPSYSPLSECGDLGGQLIFELKEDYVEVENHVLPMFSTGKEVLLVKSIVDELDYMVLENFRFDDKGVKRFRFENNRVYYRDGSKNEFWELIQRFATNIGCSRFIDSNQSIFNKDRMVVVPAIADMEHVDDSHAAQKHYEGLLFLVEKNHARMICLHCNLGITTRESYLVEIDEEGLEHTAGNVHAKCLRPSDRVLGRTVNPSLPEKTRLNSFDWLQWTELIEHGQNALRISKTQHHGKRIPIINWNPRNLVNEGNWCIQETLSNGEILFIKIGSKIHRFSDEKIDSELEWFRNQNEIAKEKQDPFVYDTVTKIFGSKSVLETQTNKDNLAFIENYEKVRYSALLKEDQASWQFLAPLCLVLDPETQTFVHFNGLVPLISNPLDFGLMLENWELIGMDDGEFDLAILAIDHQLDLQLRDIFNLGMKPCIDPIFDSKGNLDRGIWIVHMDELKMMSEKRG